MQKKCTVVFFFLFFILFQTIAQNTKSDIVLLVDTSGTMLPYFQETNSRILTEIGEKLIRTGDTVHLVSYNRNAQIELVQQIQTKNDITKLTQQCNVLFPIGIYADILSAVSYAEQYLLSLGTATRKTLVIVTDGKNNPPQESTFYRLSGEETESALQQRITQMKSKRINTYIAKAPYSAANAVSENYRDIIQTEPAAAYSAETGIARQPSETAANAYTQSGANPPAQTNTPADSRRSDGTNQSGNTETNSPFQAGSAGYPGQQTAPDSSRQSVQSDFSQTNPAGFNRTPQDTATAENGSNRETSFAGENAAKTTDTGTTGIPLSQEPGQDFAAQTAGNPGDSDTNSASGVSGTTDTEQQLSTENTAQATETTGTNAAYTAKAGNSGGMNSSIPIAISVLVLLLAAILIAVILRNKKAKADYQETVPANGAMPTLDAAGQKRSSMPTLGAAGQKQSSMPTLGAAGQKQSSMPTLGAAGQKRSSMPELTAAMQKGSSMPTLDAAAQKRNSMPTLGAAGQKQSSMPELTAAMQKGSSMPTLDAAAQKRNSMPTLDSAMQKRSSMPELTAAMQKGSSMPTLAAQSAADNTVQAQNAAEKNSSAKSILAAAEAQKKNNLELPSLIKPSTGSNFKPADSAAVIEKKGDNSITLEMTVDTQNRNIGLRNIHTLVPGSRKSVGGGFSAYSIFVVQVPASIAEIRYDGTSCSLAIFQPQFFPYEQSAIIENCIDRPVFVRTQNGYEMQLSFKEYKSKTAALNELLLSVIPEKDQKHYLNTIEH